MQILPYKSLSLSDQWILQTLELLEEEWLNTGWERLLLHDEEVPLVVILTAVQIHAHR
jgi:hypothetical protein